MKPLFKLTVVFALLSFGLNLTASAEGNSDNLIKDPNFETIGDISPEAAWILNPTDTQASMVKGDNGSDLQIENSADSTVQDSRVFQMVSLEQGGSYEMQFSAKGEGDAEYQAYAKWEDDEGYHNEKSEFAASDENWEDYSFDFRFEFTGVLKSSYIVFQVKGTGKVLFSGPSLVLRR